MFAGLANLISKHSKAVILVWIILLAASAGFALKSGDVLVYDMTEMSGSSTESSEGQAIISDYFTSTTTSPDDILVIVYEDESQIEAAQLLYSTFSDKLADEYDGELYASWYGTYTQTGKTGGAAMVAIYKQADSDMNVSKETGDIRDIVSDAKKEVKNSVGVSFTTYVTGNAAISYDTEKSSMEDVSKVDPLSIALIFILLGLFFYALVTALVPPAVVGMAYVVVLMILYVVGSIIDVFYITQVLILVSMLGAGCDYAIFIITRYRDERKKGHTHDEALREAIMWGGEAVFTSGVAVIIGFAALAICTFSMIQTMGIILAVGIFFALLAALTFIPALLNLVGEKIFWPSNIEKYQKEQDAIVNGGKKNLHACLSSFSKKYFGWLAAFTQKRAIAIAVVLVLVAAPSLYTYATTEDSADMISVMPDSEATEGLDAIMTYASGGMIMPSYVVLDLGYSIGTVGELPLSETQTLPYVVWNDQGKDLVPTIMGISQEVSEKYTIIGTMSGTQSWSAIYMMTAAKIGSTDPTTINQAIVSQMPSMVSPYIDQILQMKGYGSTPDTKLVDAYPITIENVMDGILNISTSILDSTASYVNMMVITNDEPMSDETMDFVEDLRNDFHGKNGYDKLGLWKESYVTGTAASMLDVSEEVEDQFGSIRIVVAILLIVLLFFILGSYLTPIRGILTILLSVIITVTLTRIVFDAVLGIPVLFLVPIVLFVVLLGLGMDYEIFLTTKIRENKSKGMDNHEAISMAIKEAGPVISLCALIMGGTFLTMVLANSSMLQEFGFALGVGILIDGLLMVGFVSPALMHLMGDWSWKGPAFLTRRHGMNPDGSAMDKSEPAAEQEE